MKFFEKQKVRILIRKLVISAIAAAIVLDSLGLYPIEGMLKIPEAEADYQEGWGVLAINTNKSIYLPGETAKLSFAVLDDDGNMVCDASLRLKIESENLHAGKAGLTVNDKLSTDDGKIKVNPEECAKKAHTNVPDYKAEYKVQEIGVYKLVLTANTPAGETVITDSFEVRSSVQFNIERNGPTRIYPVSPYEMKVKIEANEDFKGQVIETVPGNFDIVNQELRIKNQGRSKSIIHDP